MSDPTHLATAARVTVECDCGLTWTGPGRALSWIQFSHDIEHEKGRGGLPASSRRQVREVQADTEPEAEADV